MTARNTGHFDGVDLEGLWSDSEYSRTHYEGPAPDDATLALVEEALGYRLPDSFVELARVHNGGLLKRSVFPVEAGPDVIEAAYLSGLFSIGGQARYSLLGAVGSAFWFREWGYPEIGVVIADTISAGHDLILLDYRDCGPTGEPAVVHVDQESDYAITPLAPDFATFVRGLVSEEEFDDPAQELAENLAIVQRGSLSPILRRTLDAVATSLPEGERALRALAERIVVAKGFFSLHADPDSHLMYDVLFWLFSAERTASSFEDYFDRAPDQVDYERACHVLMMRMSFTADPYGFRTGGYAEGFVRDWWDARVQAGDIVAIPQGWRPAEAFAARVRSELAALAAS